MASWKRGVLVAAGYAAAVAAAAAIVEMRSRSLDPAVASASSGMLAFGQVLWFLLLAGLFSLPPTWFLARMLRGAERLWGFLARTGLPWAVTAPFAAAAFAWGSGGGLSALAFLRLLLTPGSLVVLLATWRTSMVPDTRRRALRALVLEACGLLGLAAWIGKAILARI